MKPEEPHLVITLFWLIGSAIALALLVVAFMIVTISEAAIRD